MPGPTRRSVLGVGLLFVSNGALFASLLPWYPALARELSLSPGDFGLVVASFAVGALASSALPAPLIGRFGAGAVTVGMTLLAAVAVWAAGASSTGTALAIGLFGAGLSDAVADVAQNVVGIRVQTQRKRPILSSMHALWSLGAAAGGAAATVAAGAQVNLTTYLLFSGLVSTLIALVGVWLVGPTQAPPRPEPESGTAPGFQRATLWVALPVVAISISGTTVEDVANNWAAISAHLLAGVPESGAGLAFTVALASQCVGRFTGDWLTHRWGAAAIARFGGILIGLGAISSATATSGPQLLIGFALAGFGCATLVPNAMAAGARLPGMSDHAGVTLVSWLMRLGFLATSPLIGLIAELSNLRWGLSVLFAAGAMAVLFAGRLAPHVAQ